MAKSTTPLRDDESSEPSNLKCSEVLLRPAGLLIHLDSMYRDDIPSNLARAIEHRIQVTSEHGCHHVVPNAAIDKEVTIRVLPDEAERNHGDQPVID